MLIVHFVLPDVLLIDTQSSKTAEFGFSVPLRIECEVNGATYQSSTLGWVTLRPSAMMQTTIYQGAYESI